MTKTEHSDWHKSHTWNAHRDVCDACGLSGRDILEKSLKCTHVHKPDPAGPAAGGSQAALGGPLAVPAPLANEKAPQPRHTVISLPLGSAPEEEPKPIHATQPKHKRW